MLITNVPIAVPLKLFIEIETELAVKRVVLEFSSNCEDTEQSEFRPNNLIRRVERLSTCSHDHGIMA